MLKICERNLIKSCSCQQTILAQQPNSLVAFNTSTHILTKLSKKKLKLWPNYPKTIITRRARISLVQALVALVAANKVILVLQKLNTHVHTTAYSNQHKSDANFPGVCSFGRGWPLPTASQSRLQTHHSRFRVRQMYSILQLYILSYVYYRSNCTRVVNCAMSFI